MFPYFLLIGIPLIFSLFDYPEEYVIANKRFPLYLFFAIFIILLSIRSVYCGIDLMTYRNKFESIDLISIRSLFDFSIIEPGYELFVSSFKLVTDNFQIFICLCALLSVAPIMVLYAKETYHNLLTIALFLGVAPFTIFFSALRQSIAIGLSVFCYCLCKKKKLIPFLLVVFLAFTFHQSALIILPMYPLMNIKITKKWILPLTVLYIICLMFNKRIFWFLLQMNKKYESRYTISNTGSYTFIVLLIFLTVYSFIIPNDDVDEITRLRNLLVFSLLLQSFAPINTVAMRLNYYYLIFIPILIPKIIDNCKTQYKSVAIVSTYFFTMFFILWFFKEAYTGTDFLHVFPYIGFWEA